MYIYTNQQFTNQTYFLHIYIFTSIWYPIKNIDYIFLVSLKVFFKFFLCSLLFVLDFYERVEAEAEVELKISAWPKKWPRPRPK